MCCTGIASIPLADASISLLTQHPCPQERLHRGEWAAVVLAVLGTVGIGASSGEEAPAQEGKEPSTARILGVFALLCALVASLSLVQRRRGVVDKRAPGRGQAKPPASVYGLQVPVLAFPHPATRHWSPSRAAAAVAHRSPAL